MSYIKEIIFNAKGDAYLSHATSYASLSYSADNSPGLNPGDFRPHLPVSRLEYLYEISQIITKFTISCRLDFPIMNFQILFFCIVMLTSNIPS